METEDSGHHPARIQVLCNIGASMFWNTFRWASPECNVAFHLQDNLTYG